MSPVCEIAESCGPKTGLFSVTGVCVDPITDKVVVNSASRLPGGKAGQFIFNRTDSGDVPPQAVIAGPHTGIIRPWGITCDPQDGKIFVAVENNYFGLGAYKQAQPRAGFNPAKARVLNAAAQVITHNRRSVLFG